MSGYSKMAPKGLNIFMIKYVIPEHLVNKCPTLKMMIKLHKYDFLYNGSQD